MVPMHSRVSGRCMLSAAYWARSSCSMCGRRAADAEVAWPFPGDRLAGRRPGRHEGDAAGVLRLRAAIGPAVTGIAVVAVVSRLGDSEPVAVVAVIVLRLGVPSVVGSGAVGAAG